MYSSSVPSSFICSILHFLPLRVSASSVGLYLFASTCLSVCLSFSRLSVVMSLQRVIFPPCTPGDPSPSSSLLPPPPLPPPPLPSLHPFIFIASRLHFPLFFTTIAITASLVLLFSHRSYPRFSSLAGYLYLYLSGYKDLQSSGSRLAFLHTKTRLALCRCVFSVRGTPEILGQGRENTAGGERTRVFRLPPIATVTTRLQRHVCLAVPWCPAGNRPHAGFWGGPMHWTNCMEGGVSSFNSLELEINETLIC